MGDKRWYGRRAARLGYLVGCGMTFEQVAKDPVIIETLQGLDNPISMLRNTFDRYKLPKRMPAAVPIHMGLDLLTELTQKELEVLALAATKRKVSIDKIAVLILKTTCNDGLIDGVLDDEEQVAA